MYFSHCSQHRWKKRIYNPGKKSVFAVQDDDNGSQDETAGDDDENVTDQVPPSGSCQQLPAVNNDMETDHIKDGTIAPAMVDKSTCTTSLTEEPKKLEDLLTVKKAFTKDPEGSDNTIAQKFSSSVNICLKLPTFPLTPESCFIDKSNTDDLNDENVVEKSLGAAGASLKGVASEPCLRTHADYLETKKAVIHECSAKVAGSLERVAVLDGISPDQMKTKIAWVPLGTCPVCQTDLDSMHASEPCHNPCASDNDGLVLEEVDDTSTSLRTSPSLSSDDAKILENKAVSSANKKAKCDTADSNEKKAVSSANKKAKCDTADSNENKAVSSANKKAKCDTADSNDVTVSNISNNALPKPKKSSKKAKCDIADSDDVAVSNISNNALPKPKKSSSNTSLADTNAKCTQSCEECHDVQPSESYEEQGESVQVRQKTKKQSKVRSKAKTQSRSSSGSVPVSR